MKKHVLILGAGFGGLELAKRLSETLADAVRVTLVDRNDSFVFGFSKLEVMLGRQFGRRDPAASTWTGWRSVRRR
jgi:sulfide:quinone oxidoreductase